jgi:peroxiredoxin
MNKSLKSFFAIFLPGIILLIALCYLKSEAASVNIGQKVTPAVLKDYHGANINLGNSIGRRVTVIWICDLCKVCERGFDNYLSISDYFSSRQVDFYLISTVNEELTENFVKKYNITTPVLLGGSDPLTQLLTGQSGYGLCPMDNIFLMDRNGILRFRGHLPGITNRDMQNIINRVLQ